MLSVLAPNASRAASLRKSRNQRHSPPALLESLESRVLLSAAPVGTLTIFNRTEISGWAFDPDTTATSLTIQIKIDGIANDVTASLTRPGLGPIIGSTNHGFDFTVPALTPGPHTIVVGAADSTTGIVHVIASGTLTNPPPTGTVETISPTTVSGFAFDSDAGATPISVRIDNDGATVTTVTAGDTRTTPIATPNHGFSVSGSFNIVDVYALDSPTGTPVLIGTNSVKPIGAVTTFNTAHISGWAATPDTGGTGLGIEVDVDGVSFQTGTANLSTHISNGHNNGFDIALNALTPGAHTVKVFATDPMSSSNAKVLLSTAVLTNPAPKGAIQSASATLVTGYAFDANAGAAPISVQIKVDDVLKTTVTANLVKPALLSLLGSTAHGFSAPISGLTAGPHKIAAYALDNPSGTPVWLGTNFINNTLPVGFLGNVNSFTIKGWARDADSPGTPVNVIVMMDGVRYPASAANGARPDLVGVFADTNHGFSITTPTHLSGIHTVTVIAQDTFTGQEVVLGTRTFVNNAPRGGVGFFTATSVGGWAQDIDAPTTSIQVLLSTDGVITSATANINLPGLTPIIGSPNHGFTFSYSALPAGHHTLKVFAVDPATGVSTLIGSKTIIVA